MADDLKKISATLDLLKDQQAVMDKKLDNMQQTLDSHTGKLTSMEETLESHTGSLMNIEVTLEGYADAYKVNKSNIERLDERLSKAEDQFNIPVPPELAIQR